MKRERIHNLSDDLHALDTQLGRVADQTGRQQAFSEGFHDRLTRRLEEADAAISESANIIDTRSLIFKWGLAAAACLALVITGYTLLQKPMTTAGTLEFVEGVAHASSNGLKLTAGDTLSTEDGRLVAVFDARAHVLLNHESEIYVDDLNHLSLIRGEIFVHVEPGSGDFHIETATGARIDVIGTSYLVRVVNDETLVETYSGIVEVSTEKGSVRVEKGRSAVAQRNAAPLTAAGSEEPALWAEDLTLSFQQARRQSFFPSVAPVGESSGSGPKE